MFIALPCALYFLQLTVAWDAPEPFPPLHDFDPHGQAPVPTSPDPLVSMTWKASVNTTELQIYRAKVKNVFAEPAESFVGLESLTTGDAPNVTILGPGSIRLDFGVERAAWLEFESGDLNLSAVSVSAAISENTEPYAGKTQPVKAYGSTFRLETNPELYEGVRFAWILVQHSSDKNAFPWHIHNVAAVAKIKPVNYTGSFKSADPMLERIWYTGAYAVRLNMEADAFNSILIDRGDRVSIQGDGHTTMAAALVAFSPFRLVHDMIWQTNSGSVHGHSVVDSGILAYPIYWTMSVFNWFWASGELAGFQALVPDVRSILDARIHDFLQQPTLVWMGPDDRLGNCWCGNDCGREAQLTFASLLVLAVAEFVKSLKHADLLLIADEYSEQLQHMHRELRNLSTPEGGVWHTMLGLHAAANAINAGVPNASESMHMFKANFNDSTTVCSLAPFNQYWILQAYGNAGMMDYALAYARLCWGTMLKFENGCFLELYSPEWSTFLKEGDVAPSGPSYCHPWSSGVTSWLTHNVAGLRPLQPGYESFLATPYVAPYTHPHVEAGISTPFGSLSVKAKLVSARYSTLSIRISAEVPGRVGIRRSYEEGGCVLLTESVRVDGSMLDVVTGHELRAALGVHDTVALDHAWTTLLSPGKRYVEAVYECTRAFEHAIPLHGTNSLNHQHLPHFKPFPEPRYKAATRVDSITRGSWLGTYGEDGYVMFGFDHGSDCIKLPEFVHNVTILNHDYPGKLFAVPRHFSGYSVDNRTFLQDPLSFHPRRRLGYAEGQRDDGSQGILLDINTTVGVSYEVAVYFVAGAPDARQAIRVLDLERLDVIAPTPLVSNFSSGFWWVLKYSRGVRLRLMAITPQVTVSGVFFKKLDEVVLI